MNDKTEPVAAELSGENVADYLRRHPEFFDAHPALLAELQLPHSSGNVVSLIERQVSLLRAQNEQSGRRLRDLIDIARRNEELAMRMHQLALSLMDAAEPKDIFSTLYESLRTNFTADRVSVRLFAEPAFIDSFPGPEFAGRERPEQALFRAITEKKKPLTGRMKKQQQVFLFGDDGDDIASGVLVPLQGPDWSGVLAIGSTSPTRFTEGMGVELLRNLGEVLSLVVKPWVREK